MEDLRKFLRTNPVFWSRLGFCYDPPRAGADGQPILFSHELDEYVRVHRDFEKAGVKIHTTILHSGWMGDGRYDYSLTDTVLDALFQDNPDIWYLPRVKLNMPPDWCRNHPEDTFVYAFGPRDADSIAALAGTDRHDWFGFDGDGYSVNGGKGAWRDDRKNRQGCIGLQSFSSEKWVEDASETLRRLLIHLSESPYRDRILGVHVAYGMCGETNVWGSWSPLDNPEAGQFGRRGDFGIRARERFARFGVEKYGSAEAAIAHWGDLEPPTPLEREAPAETLSALLLPEGSKLRDYFTFVSETNADACEAFCRIVKESGDLFGHPLAAGVFYGYLYLPQAPNAGHLAIDRLAGSPYVDFMSSPKGYYRCLAGDPGGEQGPSESITRKTVWLDEIDNHTHLDRRPEGRAASLDESVTLLWREAVKNISHDQGFWWMDLGEGWYDDPTLMGEIAAITELQRELADIPHESIAQVLLVVDDRSMGAMRISYGLYEGLLHELHSELKLIGAPVDTLRLCDLYDMDLSRYRMVVFANCFAFEKGQRERLLPLLQGKLVLWHYAAGILAPDFDKSHFTALTGFTLRELPRTDPAYNGYPDRVFLHAKSHKRQTGDFPLFTIDAPGMEVLTRYDDGQVNCAMLGNTAVCATPSLNTKELRMLAVRAGVDILCDTDCTVYGDNRLLGFFPKEAFEGTILVHGQPRQVRIPAKGKYIVR